MLGGVISIMDAVLLALLLISMIVGCVKGFAKQILSLIGVIAVVVAAALLCTKFSNVVYSFVGKSLSSSYGKWLTDLDAEAAKNGSIQWFTQTLDWTNESNQTAAIGALNLPALLVNIIKKPLTATLSGFGTCALVDALPPVLARWTSTAIAFVVLFLLIGLLVIIIKKLIYKLVASNKSVKSLDRILGMIASVVYMYVIVSTVLALITSALGTFTFFNWLQELLKAQAELSANGKFAIFNFVYNNNFIGNFIVEQMGKILINQ